jgi:hypothetical protein
MGDDEARKQLRPSSDDWTYHGIGPSTSVDGQAHILVEQTVFGLTERNDVLVLRELPTPSYGGYAWSYNGGGPARAAAAILADALEFGDPGSSGLQPGRSADGLGRLRRDFCWDVLTQVAGEWRLRRGAILRWVLGWYAENGISGVPAAAMNLPPADPFQDDDAY